MAWNRHPNEQLLDDWQRKFDSVPNADSYFFQMMDGVEPAEMMEIRRRVFQEAGLYRRKDELAQRLIAAYRTLHGSMDLYGENRIHVNVYNYLAYMALIEYENKHLLKRIV